MYCSSTSSQNKVPWACFFFRLGFYCLTLSGQGEKWVFFFFFNVNTALEVGALNSVIGALGNSQGRAADSLIISEASWAARRGPH